MTTPGAGHGGAGDYTVRTVTLIPEALRALQDAARLNGHSETDTINRALQLYAYIALVQATGGDICVREPGQRHAQTISFADRRSGPEERPRNRPQDDAIQGAAIGWPDLAAGTAARLIAGVVSTSWACLWAAPIVGLFCAGAVTSVLALRRLLRLSSWESACLLVITAALWILIVTPMGVPGVSLALLLRSLNRQDRKE